MKDIPEITEQLIFTNGKKVYTQLAKEYIRHSSGLFILAPSGSGKTYFVEHQTRKDWIDGDLLWSITGADNSSDDWNDNIDDVMEINARSDVITQQAKKQGFWVIGSSNLYLKPDAIVIPDKSTHIKYITKREKSNYDGGAKINDLEGVNEHITWMKNTWDGKVPFFSTIDDAVSYLKNYVE